MQSSIILKIYILCYLIKRPISKAYRRTCETLCQHAHLPKQPPSFDSGNWLWPVCQGAKLIYNKCWISSYQDCYQSSHHLFWSFKSFTGMHAGKIKLINLTHAVSKQITWWAYLLSSSVAITVPYKYYFL